MSDDSSANPSSEEALQALREALRASPNNLALRHHFADMLLSHGHLEEAEKEYRDALALAPNSLPLKFGLARAFYQQGKQSHALVIIEDLVKNANAPPRAFLLHARLLAGIGEIQKAVSEYRRAVKLDRSLADAEFAGKLGIGADEQESEVARLVGR
jgi:predicted Zn-dependent protease